MADQFLGEIRAVGFNFAPIDWALCNGQILSISQNTALFALLGTSFGGNGTSTFGLPNLQNSVPMHWGNGAGLTPRVIGEVGGSDTVTLLETEMPSHTHSINGSPDPATTTDPASALPAVTTRTTFAPDPTSKTTFLNPQALASAGGSQPHNNIQPTLVVNFIIALVGIFPSRG